MTRPDPSPRFSDARRRALAQGLGLCALALSGSRAARADTLELTYPRPESDKDRRSAYQVELLTLALTKSGAGFSLRPADRVLTQAEVVNAQGSASPDVSVSWSMTSPEREAALLPIRIPIDKGLLGWRVCLLRADRYDLFRSVRTVKDLRRFTAIQGAGWPDVEILRSNGLPVLEATSYEQGFKRLSAHKADYFPRALMEYRDELNSHRTQGLVLEPYLVIRYPAASYFFVRRDNRLLAEQIRTGLERAIADGSFDRLFYQHHAQIIEEAGLAQRRVIELGNPLLPPETPRDRKALWFRAETMR